MAYVVWMLSVEVCDEDLQMCGSLGGGRKKEGL